MKRRVISIALASAMALSLLAGCSEKGGTTGTESTPGAPKIEDNKPKTHTLNMLGREGGSTIKFAEREKYPVWGELQKLLDEKGLKINYELVANEQYQVVIQTRLASGTNMPDIANISTIDTASALTLAKQGTIIDVNGPIAQYSDGTIRATIDKYYPFVDGLATAPDGNRYWFTDLHVKSYNKTDPALSVMSMNVRKDWLEKLGLDIPKTVDDFYDMLTAFREKDANGNGAKDEVIVLDPKSFSNGIAQWFGLGLSISSIDATNMKMVTPWYQEGIKEYFKYMKKLFDAGILDTTGLANVSETFDQRVAENRIGADYSYALETWTAPSTPDPDAAYMPIKPLTSVAGITPYSAKEPHLLVWSKYAITKSCKDIEGAIAFFDVIYSEKYIELTAWGIKGDFYDVDKDGNNIFINQKPDEENAKLGRARGRQVWGQTVFPVMQVMNLEYELVPPVPQFKIDYQIDMMGYEPWYATFNSAYLALPSDEQLEAANKIRTALVTYSEELATKIILGQSSLDQWDTYIAKFKDLGLDQLLAIDQALLERYQELE